MPGPISIQIYGKSTNGIYGANRIAETAQISNCNLNRDRHFPIIAKNNRERYPHHRNYHARTPETSPTSEHNAAAVCYPMDCLQARGWTKYYT